MIYKTIHAITYNYHFEHHSHIYLHLEMSVVQSLGKLLKLLTHLEGDGVVSDVGDSLDDVLVPLLLNHLLQLQLHDDLS